MKKTFIAAAMGMSVLATGLAATPASAQRYGYVQQDRYYDGRGYERDYRSYDDGYRSHRNYYRGDRRCRSGSTGTILGAVAGALLGGEIGRGSSYRRSGTGTIIGAGAGALIGREIDRGNCNDRRYRR
jgi:hypothetical protein